VQPSNFLCAAQDEEAAALARKAKRKRSGGYDSDDSDFDDLRGRVADATAAMRGVRFAPSNAGTGVARSVRSMGGRSAASQRSAGSGRSAGTAKSRGGGRGGGPSMTGERYVVASEALSWLRICKQALPLLPRIAATGRYQTLM
jgi:hypothetical protein